MPVVRPMTGGGQHSSRAGSEGSDSQISRRSRVLEVGLLRTVIDDEYANMKKTHNRPD